MEICKKESCTGCGACAYICPKSCVEMRESKSGALYPYVDESKCVSCNACRKVCPQINKLTPKEPFRAYAAWSANPEERRTSASGAIAAELYKHALSKGFYCVGAATQKDFSVILKIAENESDLREFKNSKYVFSTAYSIYPEIKRLLDDNKKVIVIALPCQIAAMKNVFKNAENLFLCELVCHGTTPVKYLREHIDAVEKECGFTADKISFRDPEKGTENFYLSLYDIDGNRRYSKRTMHGDRYQYGYHRTISYRENCYSCIFARKERISDLTLSDYKGLKNPEECGFTEKKLSAVLVNTEKGQRLMDELIAEEKIVAFERPVAEPINGDAQLRRPSEKSKARLHFEKQVKKNVGFETAMKRVMRRVTVKNKIKTLLGKVKVILRGNNNG